MAVDMDSGKLVRDKIPEIIKQAGKDPSTSILDPVQYLQSLHVKLDEEVGEVHDTSEIHLVGEIADVLEVLRAIAYSIGVTWDHVEAERKRKFDERGGFEGRIWLHQPY